MEARAEPVSPQEDVISVIDLFAGPGGLGEGFSQWETADGVRPFKIKLSIEKDPAARRTLLLRSFFRQFPSGAVPEAYYQYLRGEVSLVDLFDAFPDQAEAAEREAWEAKLGEVDHALVRERINDALGPDPGHWVLIGGPPCQAYSLVGRARIKGRYRKLRQAELDRDGKSDLDPDSEFDKDDRHLLYKEYLRIIADHRPAVFIMENVPGLLSSQKEGSGIVKRIMDDLKRPVAALSDEEHFADAPPLEYKLSGFSEAGARDLFEDELSNGRDPRSFVVKAEEYGVPQARRRLLIVGVRLDLAGQPAQLARREERVSVEDAIGDMPRLRSRLSRTPDSPGAWSEAVSALAECPWFSSLPPVIRTRMSDAIEQITSQNERGCLPEPLSSEQATAVGREGAFLQWCRDSRLGHVCNHEARAHMRADLWRYLYAASYALEYGSSPKIVDFPEELRPAHESAVDAATQRNGMFADRFRVQLKGRPARTVVSHIARDGHYYIHYDPTQCRSLTVREAARLQSFPDNYLFEGNRTEQFIQVGNAVPPLLAYQVAGAVYQFLDTQVRPPAPVVGPKAASEL